MLKDYVNIERLSVRLDKKSQSRVNYLIESGYGQTDLIRAGIELLYQKEKMSKPASIPALLKTFFNSTEFGPEDLSENRKQYYKDLMLEKYTG